MGRPGLHAKARVDAILDFSRPEGRVLRSGRLRSCTLFLTVEAATTRAARRIVPLRAFVWFDVRYLRSKPRHPVARRATLYWRAFCLLQACRLAYAPPALLAGTDLPARLAKRSLLCWRAYALTDWRNVAGSALAEPAKQQNGPPRRRRARQAP